MMSYQVYTVGAEVNVGRFAFRTPAGHNFISDDVSKALPLCGPSVPVRLSTDRQAQRGRFAVYTLTIGEFIDREGYEDIPYSFCIYVIRNKSTVFYVGQSNHNVINRLWQHIGPPMGYTGPLLRHFDDIGRFIAANYPQSRDWQIDLLTLDDCANYLVFQVPNSSIDAAESYLIWLMNPCLNRLQNHTAITNRLAGYELPWIVTADQWPEM